MTTGELAAAWAAGVCAGLAGAAVRHIVYVPDNPLALVMGILRTEYPDVATTIATREEEAFGIAAGLYLGGRRPAVLLQSSGLGNSLNALASLLVPYRIPVLAVVSMRGDEGEWNDAQVPMGRAVVPACDALGLVRTSADSAVTTADAVRLAAEGAQAAGRPGVCLLPRRVTMPAPVTSEARR